MKKKKMIETSSTRKRGVSSGVYLDKWVAERRSWRSNAKVIAFYLVFENWTEYKLSKKPAILLDVLKLRLKVIWAKIKLFIESLILAQDERWRRA